MRGLSIAFSFSLAAHVAAAGGILAGWPGNVHIDQPGSPIFAELVYERPAPDRGTESAAQTATLSAASLAIPDAPAAPEAATASLPPPESGPIPIVEDSGVAALPVSTAKNLPAVETVPPESSRPNNVAHERPQVVLRSTRRVTAVPRHKPPVPQVRSKTVSVANETINDEAEIVVPDLATPLLSSVDLRQTPKAEKTQDRGVRVASLPAGRSSSAAKDETSAPEYASPSLGNRPPKYPYAARRRGMEGRVVIEAVVDRAGQVTTAVVATSSGHRILDRAALVAVKEWMFQPARRAGRAVGATIAVPISFSLKEEAAFASE